MKREDHFERIVVFLACLFIVLIILPGLIAARSGQSEIPVTHDFSLREETVSFHPENGWNIQGMVEESDSGLVLEEVPATESILVSVSDLDAGKSGNVQLLCQRESAPEGEDVELIYTISRENDGSFAVRVYPEDSELLNVNYMYTYEPENV